jgi:hypothetical protein
VTQFCLICILFNLFLGNPFEILLVSFASVLLVSYMYIFYLPIDWIWLFPSLVPIFERLVSVFGSFVVHF